MALWDRLKGGIVGGAIGFAARDALEPAFEPVKQEGWKSNRNKVLPAELAAALHAEDGPDPGQLADDAARQGFSDGRYAALVELARSAPGFASLMDARRRKTISDAAFIHGLRKHKIPHEWDESIRELLTERLDPAVIAAAIVRGLIDDPGILPVGPPSAVGRVPKFPVFDVDAVQEALDAGLDLERLSVLVGNYGRPMSPEAAAFAVHKGIIDRVDFDRAVAEGDVRNEWADSIFENSRFVLSPQDAAGLRLRGWKTKAEAEAIGALHGASPETMENLFLNRGRPATVHQVHIGYARGGRHPDVGNNERETVQKAIQQSDIRPEWADLLWAQRYTMPSAFVLRALTQDGTFTQAQAEDILLESGWRPDLAAAASEKWSGGGAGPSTKWADRARSQLFTAAHSDYLDGNAEEADARAMLARVGATGAEQDAIISIWDMERNRTRRDLTQAQILKLYKKAIWSRDQALAGLDDLGMDIGDAGDLLDSV